MLKKSNILCKLIEKNIIHYVESGIFGVFSALLMQKTDSTESRIRFLQILSVIF